MGTFIKIFLTLCTLHLCINLSQFVNASRRPWTAAAKNWAGIRRGRAVGKPTPIECQLGRWSSWTPCNACTDKKIRSRNLERPSQFGGTECYETLWENLACPNATTQCLVPDYCGDSFTCTETGRCISQSLRCNGERDCDDFSDEDDCVNFNQRDDKCSTILPIPGADRGTQGYNVLTGDFVDLVLDPKYFDGKCEYVYNGEWRKYVYDAFCENLHYNEDEKYYRKPYNYHTYRFVAQARSEGSQEYYEDMVSLLKARQTTKSSHGGATVGVYYVEVGLSGSDESKFLTNITKYTSENQGFVRLWSKVETAHFKMRSNKLMLHEDFYVSLMELPEEYDFGMYARFFSRFGTHYVTEGTMGGTVEYVLVLNKIAMRKSKLEGSEAGRCFGASLGLSIPVTESITIAPKLSGKTCNKGGSFAGESSGHAEEIEDVVSLVKGGILYTSSGLLGDKSPEIYKQWGASLKYNPILIDYETMPIYELVRLSTVADHVGARLANLERGWNEYLQQFDSCRCAPCKHNGIPALRGTSCSCICPSGYLGAACEETERSDTKTDGAWSCWGSWQSCASGRKTRTRTCNNPAPSGGGAACLGSTSQTQRC
ncbi:complement component C8 alpha chain [Centropristis striata]|uniref:complement component C8 alpha chain n=1 Tax=Centropristis striata TaxID=184440 RepID=UPI0027E07D84|nr:complement component C8 alpha chain [Centropristis striata]